MLNRRFPLRIKDGPNDLVVLSFSFLPESAEEARRLSISPDGSSASLVVKKSLQQEVSDTNDDTGKNEYHLSGSISADNSTEYYIKLENGKDEFCLESSRSVTGLKRDRKNDFQEVKEHISKSARTTLHDKKQSISKARRVTKTVNVPTRPDKNMHTANSIT